MDEIRELLVDSPELVNLRGVPQDCTWITSPLSQLGRSFIM